MLPKSNSSVTRLELASDLLSRSSRGEQDELVPVQTSSGYVLTRRDESGPDSPTGLGTRSCSLVSLRSHVWDSYRVTIHTAAIFEYDTCKHVLFVCIELKDRASDTQVWRAEVRRKEGGREVGGRDSGGQEFRRSGGREVGRSGRWREEGACT
jgi:hypothetical protein